MSTTRGTARRFVRYEVRTVEGWHAKTPVRRLVSSHGRESRALTVAAGILAQWAKAPEKITPDTRLSVVDTDDGGIVFEMYYPGHDHNDILHAVELLQANGFTLKEVADNG